MAVNTNPIFLASRQCWAAELDNADGTTPATLATAGTNGLVIEAISATSTDTAAVELDLSVTDGTNTWVVGSVSVPAGSGTDGGTTAAVDLLQQTDLPWLRDDLTIALASGWSLKVGAHAAITAAKVVHVVAFGGEY